MAGPGAWLRNPWTVRICGIAIGALFLVAAVGNCATGRILFKESYNSPCRVDEIVPVDVYIAGCPPRPEALIHGILTLHEKVRGETLKDWA